MSKILQILFSILFCFMFLQSCKEKDKCETVICQNGQVCVDGTCVGSSTNVIIRSNITTNTTWTKNNIYELAGRISVVDGVTLTIEAGTIIKGQSGTGANATALLVARGAKLIAEGTSTSPIIFTTVADEISKEQVSFGDFRSPNLDLNANGLWGGLIILGRSPISASANEVQIEGIPTTDANGLYGGNDSMDNSGVIRYVSIRHGGANIGNGNEINGLTLGGVGAGTTIEYIEVIGNQDDGIEFFGGSVNVKNAIIVNSGDDAIDTDQSWSGTLDNFIVICGDATDHALEIDGPEGSLLREHILKNGSIKGSVSAELADFRSCARGTFENIFFFGFPDPALAARGDLSLSNPTGSTCTTDNFANNILNFASLQLDTTGMNSPALTAVFKSGTHVHAISVTTRTVGANKSEFLNWTCSSQKNLLSEF